VDGTSLCLVGPPGTAKTSIAAAIAGAAKRKLERFPLGGADDVYLVGADRAYTGARPGEIVRRLHASGRHPSELIVLLDEIDKLSRNAARDPLPVLLALLDPSQNREFQDQFLDSVRIDLSGTLFIATANDEAAIPGPLKDRMRVLRLPGYTREEQVAIGSDYILPRLLERLAISDQVRVAADVVESLVCDFPLSEGLRQLEHRISSVVFRGLRCHVETDRNMWVDADLARSWVRSEETKQPIGFRVTPAGVVGSRHILGLGGQPALGAGVAAGAPGVPPRSGPRLASTPASKSADAG
jgi:ATP-dependent Lon protease